MFRRSKATRWLSSAFLALLLASAGVPVRANDIVPSSDITGGASVFVFRGSSKKPQARGSSAKSFKPRGATASANRARLNSQARNRRSRKASAKRQRAAAVARARARERNARLKQSNILTARGEEQLMGGDFESAITTFREALKLNDKNTDAAEGLSDALTTKGIETAGADLNENAAEFLNEAISLDPKNDVAYMKLGEIHDANGRNKQAIENFEKALELDPEATAIFFPLGLAYAQEGNDEKAELYLGKAEQIGVATAESRLARALILSKQGRDEEAIAAMDAIISLEPDFGGAYSEKAKLLERAGRAEEARATLTAGTRNAPTSAIVWFEAGVSHYNAGDWASAAAAYEKVIELDDNNAMAHANLASAYRQLERYPEANAQYKIANEKGLNRDADMYSEWGFCLGKTGEWDKATARLGTAQELSPTPVDQNNVGWAYYNDAQNDDETVPEEEKNRKLELAKVSFQKAVEADANLYPAYLNLGAANNSLGDYQAAQVALNTALNLKNDWVIAINQLGVAFRGSNDLNGAIDQFVKVTTLDANNVFGLYSLGELYHLTGKKKDAKRIHDRLRAIDPTTANRLNDVLTGKIVLDEAKRKIQNKIPRIPRIPF